MSDASIPEGLKYTKDHEWAKIEGNEIVVGITKFAVEQLGDITMVTIDKKKGDDVTGGDAFGSVESVKSVSDLLAPVSGKLTDINKAAQDKAELLNEDPYNAWLVRIAVSDATALDALLDAAAYAEHVKNSA
ncbi:glycine cleavage system protein GcvH [Pendulispora albinea]|uniref:Glycine cleavage system H protein n=1 Tax=Pendulispora albinea TaxID=2741071 RepID=A0ABZ2LQU4_9BACT